MRDILKGTLSFQTSTVEQDSEFSHIDSVIASINPQFTSPVVSSKSDLPESLPVPLLADYGHFKRQDNNYILVESNDDNVDNNPNSRNPDHEDAKKFEASQISSSPGSQKLSSESINLEDETT